MSKPVDTIKGKTLDLLFCLPIHLLFVNKVREYIVMNGINQQRHSVTRLTFRTGKSKYKTSGLVEQSKGQSVSSNPDRSDNNFLFTMMSQRSQ